MTEKATSAALVLLGPLRPLQDLGRRSLERVLITLLWIITDAVSMALHPENYPMSEHRPWRDWIGNLTDYTHRTTRS